jgi:hypothetical protein
MRRRHLNGVLDIEAEVYPRPRSTTLFLSELALPDTRKGYYVESKEDAPVMALENPGSAEYLARLAEIRSGLGAIAGDWESRP